MRVRGPLLLAVGLLLVTALGQASGACPGAAPLRAAAPPALPSSFWGSVALDGRPLPAGTMVTALVDDLAAGQASVRLASGQAMYTLNTPGDDPSTAAVEGGSAGSIVTFAVDGFLYPQQAPWASGTSTRLDLAASTVRLGGAVYPVDEGCGQVQATVLLGAPLASDLYITYRTVPGTAGPEDYGHIEGTLRLPAGQTAGTITIVIRDDLLDEDDETFTLELTTAPGALLAAPQEATLAIRDDDPPPTVRLERAAYTVIRASGLAEVAVLLGAPSGKTVRVAYATSDGTARAGEDYVAASGTLTFLPGQTRKIVRVSLLAAALPGPPEAFTVSLSAPANALLTPPTAATVTIVAVAPLYLPLVAGCGVVGG